MLTLILLVVLGGGVGLFAVWLIDARGLARLLGRFAPGSLRPTRRGDTTAPAKPDPEPAVASSTAGGPVAVETLEPVDTGYEPLPSPVAAGRGGSARVPAAYTAVEGTYREVARVPVWRRLVSLVALLVILVVIGASIAALAGAVFAAVAELVDSAVG